MNIILPDGTEHPYYRKEKLGLGSTFFICFHNRPNLSFYSNYAISCYDCKLYIVVEISENECWVEPTKKAE